MTNQHLIHPGSVPNVSIFSTIHKRSSSLGWTEGNRKRCWSALCGIGTTHEPGNRWRSPATVRPARWRSSWRRASPGELERLELFFQTFWCIFAKTILGIWCCFSLLGTHSPEELSVWSTWLQVRQFMFKHKIDKHEKIILGMRCCGNTYIKYSSRTLNINERTKTHPGLKHVRSECHLQWSSFSNPNGLHEQVEQVQVIKIKSSQKVFSSFKSAELMSLLLQNQSRGRSLVIITVPAGAE